MTPADIPSLVERRHATIFQAEMDAGRRGVDIMDADAVDRYRDMWRGKDGHDMAPVNFNSLRRLVALIDHLADALSPKEAEPITDADWLPAHFSKEAELVKPPREYEVSGDAVGGIPAGMVAWAGGDGPPDDWDRGVVQWRTPWGDILVGDHGGCDKERRDSWSHQAGNWHIIAYTKQGDRSRTPVDPISANNSELEPDDRQDETNRSVDRQGGGRREVGGRNPLFASGLQRGERAVQPQGGERDLNEGARDGQSRAPTAAKDAEITRLRTLLDTHGVSYE